MSHDDFEHQNEEELTETFENLLEAVVSEIYPTLRDRIMCSGFAGWHRRQDVAEDLAQQAAFEFLRHCKKNQKLPADPLRYLVVIARNLAKKEYGRSQRQQDEFEEYAAELRARGEPTTDDAIETDLLFESEENIEIVRATVEALPRRQREAFELRTREPGATDKELGHKMGIGEDGFRKNFGRAYEKVLKLLLNAD
ncbi:MAG: sigma-70 family RNA polymerase sigma factor [bacterium]